MCRYFNTIRNFFIVKFKGEFGNLNEPRRARTHGTLRVPVLTVLELAYVLCFSPAILVKYTSSIFKGDQCYLKITYLLLSKLILTCNDYTVRVKKT
jgi:hypothetical protein